jgi:hypothetical protein
MGKASGGQINGRESTPMIEQLSQFTLFSDENHCLVISGFNGQP